ncbi:MAG: hypothetical protein ABJT05_07945 [Paracoccaceae bacterium]
MTNFLEGGKRQQAASLEHLAANVQVQSPWLICIPDISVNRLLQGSSPNSSKPAISDQVAPQVSNKDIIPLSLLSQVRQNAKQTKKIP